MLYGSNHIEHGLEYNMIYIFSSYAMSPCYDWQELQSKLSTFISY